MLHIYNCIVFEVATQIFQSYELCICGLYIHRSLYPRSPGTCLLQILWDNCISVSLSPFSPKELKKVVCCVCVRLCNPLDCICRALLSIAFRRQEYWNGLPFPSPGGSSLPKDQTHAFCIGRRVLYF